MVSVYQTVDTGHEDVIHDAQMNFYGTTLATCSSDEAIRLFDVKDKKQKLIAELKGHQGPVWGLSWAHPIHGNLLASCSYDRSVIVWAEHEGKWEKFYEYTGHESSVNAVAWAPHEYGLVLACGSSDGTISILNYTPAGVWETVKIPSAHSAGVNAVSWAPAINADFLLNPSLSQTASNLVKRIVSGGCDSFVTIWREVESNGSWVREARLDGGHTDWVRDVAWCPSLSLARQQIASCGQDGRVIVWQSLRRRADLDATGLLGPSGAAAGVEAEEVWKPVVLATYPDVVWHVSWSLTGNILAVSGGDNKVTLWKENLEGVWLALSEVARGRQVNVASSGSLAGGAYGVTATTTTTAAAALAPAPGAAMEPVVSTREPVSATTAFNRSARTHSPPLRSQPGAGGVAQPPMAAYGLSAVGNRGADTEPLAS